MSKNRENVIWESPGGNWNRGFYDYHETFDRQDEDYDEEWDVEYTDTFSWVSTGHNTMEAAERSWRGVNPGGHTEYAYTPEVAKYIARFEDEAAKTYDAVNREKEYQRAYNVPPTFEGPPKHRKLRPLMRDLNKAKLEAANHKIRGYSNSPDPKIPLWEKRVNDFAAKNNAEAIEAIDEMNNEYADKLQAKIDEARKNMLTNNQASWHYSSVETKKHSWELKSILDELEKEVEAARKSINSSNAKSSPTQANNQNASGGKNAAYHINPETGRANKCTATKKPCPFGGAENHFASKEAARKGYERSQGSPFKK